MDSLIGKCVPIPQKLYNMTKRLQTPQDVEKYFSGFMAFIDSTEQQIPKPAEDDDRKKCISGKKKRYTVKNQLMVNNRGYILHKTAHKKGSKHDYIFKI